MPIADTHVMQPHGKTIDDHMKLDETMGAQRSMLMTFGIMNAAKVLSMSLFVFCVLVMRQLVLINCWARRPYVPASARQMGCDNHY